jgi:hypothetical protein
VVTLIEYPISLLSYGLPDSEILVARDSFTPMAAAARVLLVNSTGSGYYYAPGLKAK